MSSERSQRRDLAEDQGKRPIVADDNIAGVWRTGIRDRVADRAGRTSRGIHRSYEGVVGGFKSGQVGGKVSLHEAACYECGRLGDLPHAFGSTNGGDE